MRVGYSKAADITPSDSQRVEPPFTMKGIYVGGSGNVVVRMNGTDVTFAAPAGTTLHVAPTHVLATGTTATLLVAVGD